MYVGGEQIAYNYTILKDIGITHIINAAGDVCENKFQDSFDYLTYYLKDQRTEVLKYLNHIDLILNIEYRVYFL